MPNPSMSCGCANELFAREFQHRIANVLQQAVYTVQVADRRCGDGRSPMGGRLAAACEVSNLLADGSGRIVDVGERLAALCDATVRSICAPETVSVVVQTDRLPMEARTARPLLMAVAELASNSVKHAFAGQGGRILLRLTVNHGSVFVSYEDDGVCSGWTRDGSQGHGLVDELLATLDGTVERSLTPTGSARVRMSMPLPPASARCMVG